MRRYSIADDVAWVSEDDLDAGAEPTAYVSRVPVGPPILLEGSSCVVWLALVGGGTLEEIAVAAAEMTGATVDDISDDVSTLLDQLVALRVARED